MGWDSENPGRFFGGSFVARGQEVSLVWSEKFNDTPNPVTNEEVPVLAGSHFVRRHRSAPNEEVGLWDVFKIWKPALRALWRKWVDRVVEHVTAIHAVIGASQFDTSHWQRSLDS
jgi:hypothetical protein